MRKAFAFVRIAAALLAVSSASSAAGNVLFEKVRGVLVGSVDPDAIEMARFSIAHPEDGAKIYWRAAAQDYPFFGLVGAVKAARGEGFTHDKCLFPIRWIDPVFAKASNHVSQGSGETESAMRNASSIADQYVQAEGDQAKQQLVAALSETVPYFADIGTICAFAFETDFTIEKDIQSVASQLSQDVRSAYYAFEGGDVVTGVKILLFLGASGAVACEMVDNAVGGGVIGRTPILGALARDACAGFGGDVIKGAKGLIDGGVGLGEDGLAAIWDGGQALGCTVISLIGNGCSSAEPPPTALQNAVAWCAPHGGVFAFLSKTNQPDDYSLQCNDNSQCSAKPGRAAQCATGAEIAAREAQEAALAEAEFQTRLPQWQAGFVARWDALCPDESCRTGIRIVRLGATGLAQSEHAAKPRMVFQTLTYFIFEAADRQAAAVVEDTSYRVLPPQWAKTFQSRWKERCEDNQCRLGIAFVAVAALSLVKEKADETPRPPYGSNGAFYQVAEAQAAMLVAEGVQRMRDFNKKNTAALAAAWQKVAVWLWSRECSDALCFRTVEILGEELRAAMNHMQGLHPDESTTAIMGRIGSKIALKARAAADESRARAMINARAMPVFTAGRVGPIRPFLQPWRGPLARSAPRPPGPGGRPPPRPVPAVQPARVQPTPPRRTTPIRIAPAPSAPGASPPRPIVIPPAPPPAPRPPSAGRAVPIPG